MFCLLEARTGVLGPDSRHFRVLDEPSPHQLSPPTRYAMATSPRAANNHCAAATRDATCTTFTTPIQAFQPVTATINRACPDVGIVPWAPPTKTNRRTDDIHIGQLAMVCLILHYCISYAPCLQLPHSPNRFSMLVVGSYHHVPSVVALPGDTTASPPGIASSATPCRSKMAKLPASDLDNFGGCAWPR